VEKFWCLCDFYHVMLAFRCWHLGKYWTSGSRDPAKLCPDTSSAIWPWKAICHWMGSVAPCASRAHAGSNLFSRSLRTMNKHNTPFLLHHQQRRSLYVIVLHNASGCWKKWYLHFKEAVLKHLVYHCFL